MKNSPLLYLDTNIFIYLFEGSPRFSTSVRDIFLQLSVGKASAITSVITQAELLSFSAPDPDIQRLQQLFLETPNLTVVPIDAQIAVTAAFLRRKYSFRLPDALQLATAIENKVDFFVTADSRLKKCSELEIRVLG